MTQHLLAGYGEADVTPPVPCDLNGFVARTQPGTRVAAPVQVRVVLLKSGRSGVVLAVCDLLGFTPQDSRALEQALAEAAGVPARGVLLACTHTHSGPMSMPTGLLGRFRPAYLRRVRRGLERAARAARADLAPVEGARFGATSIAALGHFRCGQREPGRDRWPGRLTALQLRRATHPITLAYAGIHPYLLSWRKRVLHPDYPGPLCDALARRTGGRAIFLPGCGADVSATGAMSLRLADVTRFGRRMAAAALEAIAGGREVNLLPLRARRLQPVVRFAHVPPGTLRSPNEAANQSLATAAGRVAANHRRWLAERKAGRLPRSAPFRALILELGELRLIGLCAELFHDTGHDLRQSLSGDRTWVVSHACGNLGYLPRPFSYRCNTYESNSAHEWYGTAGAMARGTEAQVRRAIVAAARKLAR